VGHASSGLIVIFLKKFNAFSAPRSVKTKKEVQKLQK
jgi:hypothetical protein